MTNCKNNEYYDFERNKGTCWSACLNPGWESHLPGRYLEVCIVQIGIMKSLLG